VEYVVENSLSLELCSCAPCHRLPPLGLLKGALGGNSSLKSLWISKLDAECFPDEDLLPPTLTELQFYDCPNLKSLNYNGLSELSSLNSLTLRLCPNLEYLPEEGLANQFHFFM